MDLATKVLALVGQIYDSVEQPKLWPATVERIANSIRSGSASFSVLDMSGRDADRVEIFVGGDEAAGRQYEAYYSKLNVHKLHERRMPVQPSLGTVVNSSEWGIDDKLLRSEYYNDFLRYQNAFHFLAGIVSRDDSCLALLTCYRPLHGERFNYVSQIAYAAPAEGSSPESASRSASKHDRGI